MNNKEKRSLNYFLECAAFFGVACIAISLVFAICFQGNNSVYTAFKMVGEAIAYTLSMILALFWVKRQHHVAWTILYVVFVVLILVLFVFGSIRAF